MSRSHSAPFHQAPSRDTLARRAAVVQSLRRRIGQFETAQRRAAGPAISTGCPTLDRALPGGGLAPGTLNEWLASGSGSGAATLALLAARSAVAGGKALIVIDSQARFYPPAAAAWGIRLERLIILRAAEGRNLFWAIDQALRSPAVGAVWGWIERSSGRWLRRWQLAAAAGGTLGLLVRPNRAAHQPSWSEVQLAVAPVSKGAEETRGQGARGADRRFEVRVVRVRGAVSGGTVWLELDGLSGELREISSRVTKWQSDKVAK